jgi:hypothetical protein
MDVTLGERFVDALTKKDARTLKSLLGANGGDCSQQL